MSSIVADDAVDFSNVEALLTNRSRDQGIDLSPLILLDHFQLLFLP